jgi:PhzF family phenazine biosynthesis protein
MGSVGSGLSQPTETSQHRPLGVDESGRAASDKLLAMADAPEILRYSAFAATPEGGNPAGVVLDAAHLDDASMQRIAAEVGYSETAFVVGRDAETRTFRVRFWSPAAEVPFCGHATVATAVALAER